MGAASVFQQFKSDAAGWQKAQHTKEFALLKPLQPGAFNSAEVVLSPASSEDLGQLNVTVTAGGIALRRN
jgi:hypothetical protein